MLMTFFFKCLNLIGAYIPALRSVMDAARTTRKIGGRVSPSPSLISCNTAACTPPPPPPLSVHFHNTWR